MAATDETPAAFPWKPSARDCVPLLFLFGRAVATLAGLRHGCHHAVIAALTTTVSFGELRAKKKRLIGRLVQKSRPFRFVKCFLPSMARRTHTDTVIDCLKLPPLGMYTTLRLSIQPEEP